MLKVKTYLDRSTVHGIGLFAGEDIRQGEIVWELNPKVDLRFSQEEWRQLQDELAQACYTTLKRYAYKEGGMYYVCVDNAQFMNHSQEAANICQNDPENTMSAARDISRGEELFCDYFQYSDHDDHHLIALAGCHCLAAHQESDGTA